MSRRLVRFIRPHTLRSDDDHDPEPRGASPPPPGGRKRAKLTDDAVRVIRRSRLPHGVLAEYYGVSSSTIQNVRAGRIWKHVTDDAPPPSDGPGEGATA